MEGDEVQEEQAGQMQRDSHFGVVVVPGVEKGDKVEQDDKEHEFGRCASCDGNFPSSEELNGIDRCHQANAKLDEKAFRGIEGIVQGGRQDKDRDEKGQHSGDDEERGKSRFGWQRNGSWSCRSDLSHEVIQNVKSFRNLRWDSRVCQ
jgi:hypothetical protein